MGYKSNPSVKRRFHGASGRQRLVETLLNQSLLSGSEKAAVALSKIAKLSELPCDCELMAQGGQDNSICFILSGCVRVLVNSREVATRRAGEHVGEMAMIDRTAVRSATVVTTEPSVVAWVSEPEFASIANSHPIIWRKMAATISQRLRERNRFHPPPRTVPAIFIGSSSESLPVAKAIYGAFKRRKVVPRIWSKGVFQCSRTTIENLMTETNQSDFAVLILAKDDITVARGRKKHSPRDNIVFELGLFMGALSRERTYVVTSQPMDIKIPTDLLGITLLTYKKKRGQSIAHAMRPVITEIMKLINQYGPK